MLQRIFFFFALFIYFSWTDLFITITAKSDPLLSCRSYTKASVFLKVNHFLCVGSVVRNNMYIWVSLKSDLIPNFLLFFFFFN